MVEKIEEIYKKMNAREKLILGIAIFSFIFMLTDLIVLGPVLSKIKVLDSEFESKAQGIERDMRILAFKDSIVAEYSNYESFLDAGDLSHEEIIAGLLQKLENLANRHEIKMTNILPGEIEEKPIYKLYKTTMDFEGSLRNVLIFMNLLEESDNLFQIERYTMKPKNRSGKVITINMDVARILISAEDLGEFIETPDYPEFEEEADADVEAEETEAVDDSHESEMDSGELEPI